MPGRLAVKWNALSTRSLSKRKRAESATSKAASTENTNVHNAVRNKNRRGLGAIVGFPRETHHIAPHVIAFHIGFQRSAIGFQWVTIGRNEMKPGPFPG